MAYEQKDMSGVSFRNDKKESGDRRPDETGHALVEGRKLRISRWIKQGQNGEFSSYAFEWADEKKDFSKSLSESSNKLNDTIPF